MHASEWRFSEGALSLRRPLVMAVLNVTPDSFSDGGRYLGAEAALARAREQAAAGADIIDVGGESSRPGAETVSAAEETRRVVPVIEAVATLGLPVSVDTRKVEVAGAALAAGAGILNDITGLADPAMRRLAAETGVGVVLMHMQGDPQTMQQAPRYRDVVEEVYGYLAARRDEAVAAGVEAERIVVDPGIGFGKTTEHNLRLLSGLRRFVPLAPVLVGVSRKRFLGEITGEPDPSRRAAAGVAAALAARAHGASVFRVHDVRASRDALDVWEKINNSDTASA